jgi:hypothetical protein
MYLRPPSSSRSAAVRSPRRGWIRSVADGGSSARKKAAAARRARHSGDARQRVLPPFRSLAAIVADIETAEKMVEDAKKELAERLNLT